MQTVPRCQLHLDSRLPNIELPSLLITLLFRQTIDVERNKSSNKAPARTRIHKDTKTTPAGLSFGELATAAEIGLNTGCFSTILVPFIGSNVTHRTLSPNDGFPILFALLDSRVTINLGFVSNKTAILENDLVDGSFAYANKRETGLSATK